MCTSQCYLCQLHIPKGCVYGCLPVQCFLPLPCGDIVLRSVQQHRPMHTRCCVNTVELLWPCFSAPAVLWHTVRLQTQARHSLHS